MQCRFCDNQDTKLFLKLGEMPLANSFLTLAQVKNIKEKRFPLDIYFCEECGLVQIGHVIPPEDVFIDYIYFSSTSDTIHRHAAYLASNFKKRFSFNKNSLVIEIASNDGCVLEYFKKLGVKVLGIEPARNVAKVAVEKGIDTYIDFFSDKISSEIEKNHGKADVILARHVFAHVPEIHGFIIGLKSLLKRDGVIAIEAPYLIDMVEKIEFDTVYHEHLSYLSLRPMARLFKSYGMELFEVEHFSIHGGSLIYFIGNEGCHEINPSVEQYLTNERKKGFDNIDVYNKFAEKTFLIKTKLMDLLKSLKKEGKTIAAYGAPAKGNTLLNFCGISTDIIDYIVDKSPYKQNLFTPGMHIPVLNPDRLLKNMPDYTLILAWNFADEILEQQKSYLEKGGKFIIPVPEPHIIGG
ncbi:Uncharacterised protein [uncultured archaeon]|nr:Uncharacterised protein [uncultured archaeon]